jgi:DNA-directed RNA polymerase sigma subunit (sigma70/sigma32)
MQQLVSELSRPVVLSDRALRHLARLKTAHREAVDASGREPSRAGLAERTGLTLDQVDDLLASDRAPRSLQEPISGERSASSQEAPSSEKRLPPADRSPGARNRYPSAVVEVDDGVAP